MTWHSERTWVDGEVPTKVLFDAQIRDDFLVLKVCRDANGRLIDLSSATLADLTPVSGFTLLASDNAHTTGRNQFLGSSTFVVPVGIDLFDDLGGGLRQGIWVDGDYLHWIQSNQTSERRIIGTLLAAPAGPSPRPGSLWVEGAYLKYISASGGVRRCAQTFVNTPVNAKKGSLWIQTATMRYVDASGKHRLVTGALVSAQSAIFAHLFGVSASGNTLTKTAVGGGWTDAGAVTQQVLSGNGYIEYTLTGPYAGGQAMVGLAHIDGSHRYPDDGSIGGANLYPEINHAVNVIKPDNTPIAGTMLAFYSSGTYGGEVFDTTMAYADVIRLNRTGSVITVLRNGVLVGTSAVTSASLPLVGYVVIHDPTVTVENVVLGGSWA